MPLLSPIIILAYAHAKPICIQSPLKKVFKVFYYFFRKKLEARLILFCFAYIFVAEKKRSVRGTMGRYNIFSLGLGLFVWCSWGAASGGSASDEASFRIASKPLYLSTAWGMGSPFSRGADGQSLLNAFMSMNTRVSLTSDYFLNMRLGYEQRGGQGNLINVPIRVARRYTDLRGLLQWSPHATLFLPLNGRMRRDHSYRGGAEAGVGLKGAFVLNGFNVDVSLSQVLLKNFHRYTSNSTDNVNISWNLIPSFELAHTFQNKLRVGLSGAYTVARTYNGTTKGSFAIGQTGSWQVKKNLSLLLGHTSQGNILAANGRALHVSFFSPRTSYVYAELRAQL